MATSKAVTAIMKASPRLYSKFISAVSLALSVFACVVMLISIHLFENHLSCSGLCGLPEGRPAVLECDSTHKQIFTLTFTPTDI